MDTVSFDVCGGSREREKSCEALFEEWVHAWRAELYRAAFRIVGRTDEAADCIQDAYIKSWVALQKSGHIDNPRAWLHRIVRNTALNIVRARRVHFVELSEVALLADGSDEDDVARRLDVAAAMKALEPVLRELLELHYDFGYSMAEIAYIVEMPEGTVKSSLHRARKVLEPELAVSC